MHRVPNFVSDKSTGDITGNNYYMYKQGKLAQYQNDNEADLDS